SRAPGSTEIAGVLRGRARLARQQRQAPPAARGIRPDARADRSSARTDRALHRQPYAPGDRDLDPRRNHRAEKRRRAARHRAGRAALDESLQAGAGMRRLQPADLGTARRDLDRTVEFAKHEAGRGAVATGAPNPSRSAADRQVSEHAIGIRAVDFFIQIGELRGEPRVDLDDPDGAVARAPEKLDVEQAVVEAD